MGEAAAADEAFLRLIAIEQAVDLPEIEIALDDGIAHLGAAGLLDRPLDAVGRARMAGHDVALVGHLRIARQFRIELVVGLELAEKAGHAVGIVVGAREIAHAQ